MPNTQQQIQDLLMQFNKLKSDFDILSGQFYKNNFSSRQDFNKDCAFNTVLKVPSYDTLPSCEVGEICESGGKLYIASATDVWTLVGSQS
jgi:hypothetical protein